MLAHEIRQKYLEFFQQRGHLYLPGAPLAPIDALGNPDDSTLFTGSGMQQFKPYFAGAATPPNRRVATVQKCLRTGDIDSVGDMSHCTFFEMLGNFSFGDYFKAEVIPWTWEFLTKVVGLDPDRFCVTVYIDDDDAYRIWHEVIGLPDDRIHRQGEDKNYWPANIISEGPDGLCGPCSEVFYRVAPPEEMTTDPALSPAARYTVDDEAGRWLEVWNNVFTQFDRSTDAQGRPMLTPLPQRNNDTGAGLDRIAYVSQGKTSVFETDLFGPTLTQIAALSGKEYGGSMSPVDFAFRVVAEHTRAMVFCIADGILPANEGRGYVLRYIIRRAIRYGKTALGFEEPFLHEIAPRVIEQMGDFYTELRERRELVLSTIRTEEEQFRRTLDRGMRILEDYLNSGAVQETRALPGSHAFTLYDTYGFPYRLTEELSAERGITVDRPGFDAALEAQRQRSRAGSNIDRDVFSAAALRGVLGEGMTPTVFHGYTEAQAEATVTALYQGEEEREFAGPGEEVVVVLNRTPFYAEAGGQIGDSGLLTAPAGDTTCGLIAQITDTKKNALGIYLHTAKVLEGQISIGQEVLACVDMERRRATMRNHTATHLLQAALRQVLGGHVHQKGSLVTPERLRFDFTHGQPMANSEIRQVEELVNAQALDDVEVTIHTDLPIAEARARGAMALFGEKYGDRVRMVEVPGFSLELCGGTHLSRTSQVGLFKIVGESGVAAGVRRIEAVTGRAAYEYVQRRDEILARAAARLKSSPNDLVAAVERLLNRPRGTAMVVNSQIDEQTWQDVGGIPVMTSLSAAGDIEVIKNAADRIAREKGSAVIVIGTVVDGKVAFVAKVTPDLVAEGLHAGNLVREVARITGGGGGGRPDFATAGGRDPGKLQVALDTVPRLVNDQCGT